MFAEPLTPRWQVHTHGTGNSIAQHILSALRTLAHARDHSHPSRQIQRHRLVTPRRATLRHVAPLPPTRTARSASHSGSADPRALLFA